MLDRQQEIERSIITKFRKTIWRPFTKAVRDYKLISENDKIAVCISGGKDSVLLAKCMEEIKKHGKVNFDLVYLVMNPGYNDKNLQRIIDNAKTLGIDIKIFNSNIFDVVDKHASDSPCYLCARMRRGCLYSKAQELGCNKIALGHHFNDVIETILLNMIYNGKFSGMMPILDSDNFENMKLIRKNSKCGFVTKEFFDYIKKNEKELEEIVLTGCCTDLCVMNFALPLKNYINEHNLNIKVTIYENCVETYDAPTHNREEYNEMAFKIMQLNGIETIPGTVLNR